MSDLSRELVKIFDGQKFVVKKFKNIQGEIMYKVIRNTHKLVDKIENDDGIVLSENLLSKLKINNVSIKLIDGVLAEDIVRDEVRAKEKIFKNDSDSDNEYEEIDEKKERDFNLDERLRIAHLQSKQQGLRIGFPSSDGSVLVFLDCKGLLFDEELSRVAALVAAVLPDPKSKFNKPVIPILESLPTTPAAAAFISSDRNTSLT